MKIARSLLAVTLGLAPLAGGAPAFAGSFKAPAGCEAFLTVQSRACRVSNHYRCSADAPGEQWRADFGQEGKFFESKIDFETQWIESHDLNPPTIQTLDPGPTDPASFSELLSAGIDTFDFNLSRSDGEHTRVTGFDRLTGRSTVIDNVELQETEFEFTETNPSGMVLRQSRGHEYIHPDLRMFFSGVSEWDAGDGTWLQMDGSPRLFINPGEPGFGSTQPIFDCDPVLSFLPPDAAPRG